jgi:hypothetical protein
MPAALALPNLLPALLDCFQRLLAQGSRVDFGHTRLRLDCLPNGIQIGWNSGGSTDFSAGMAANAVWRSAAVKVGFCAYDIRELYMPIAIWFFCSSSRISRSSFFCSSCRRRCSSLSYARHCCSYAHWLYCCCACQFAQCLFVLGLDVLCLRLVHVLLVLVLELSELLLVLSLRLRISQFSLPFRLPCVQGVSSSSFVAVAGFCDALLVCLLKCLCGEWQYIGIDDSSQYLRYHILPISLGSFEWR